jgi:hypothetical protein
MPQYRHALERRAGILKSGKCGIIEVREDPNVLLIAIPNTTPKEEEMHVLF